MSLWARLFGVNPKASFKAVDWLAVEGKLRELEGLSISQAQANQKQLIIQADSLVDSVLKQGRVPGTNFGERLKSLRQHLPRTIYSNLWQAHLKRNELVHEPGSFVAEWELKKHFQSFKEAISTLRGVR